MSTAGTVRTAADDGTAWVIVDNPERRNALSIDILAALGEAIGRLDADPAIHAIVIRGAGTRAFVAGADIGALAKAQESNEAQAVFDDAVRILFQTLSATRKPVIAMIHGFCIGAGMAIALAADIRLGDSAASLGIPAARMAVGYPVALTHALAATVGPARAAEILFTGDRMDAAEALRIGLLNHVYAPDDLEPATRDLARTIVGNAPLTIRAAKLSVRSFHDPSAVAAAQAAVAACQGTADAAEGPRAFQDKRAPRFVGR